MSRARLLKPSFFLNDTLAEIDPLGRLLFQALWCLADREGRLEDRPKRIKLQALPYDDCDIDALLADLAARGFIRRYIAQGIACIEVVTFKRHQTPHVKEQAMKYPLFYIHPCFEEGDDEPAGYGAEPWPVLSVTWKPGTYAADAPTAYLLVNWGDQGLGVLKADGEQLCRTEDTDGCVYCTGYTPPEVG